MADQAKPAKQKTNPFIWFLFAIVVPIIVAITLAIIIFTVAGVNVLDWVKNTSNNIPVVSSLVTTDDEKHVQQTEEKMKATIANKDEKIAELTDNVNGLEATIDEMEQKISKLENRTELNSQTDDDNISTENEKNTVKSISSSFEGMDSDQAAKVFQNLDDDLAISILKELPNDVRGEIFNEMDPEIAAELTKKFVESE